PATFAPSTASVAPAGTLIVTPRSATRSPKSRPRSCSSTAGSSRAAATGASLRIESTHRAEHPIQAIGKLPVGQLGRHEQVAPLALGDLDRLLEAPRVPLAEQGDGREDALLGL